VGCSRGPEALERLDRVLDGIFSEGMGIPFEFVAAVSSDMVDQYGLKDGRPQTAAPEVVGLFRCQVLPAELN